MALVCQLICIPLPASMPYHADTKMARNQEGMLAPQAICISTLPSWTITFFQRNKLSTLFADELGICCSAASLEVCLSACYPHAVTPISDLESCAR